MSQLDLNKVWGIYAFGNIYIRSIALFACALFACVFVSGVKKWIDYDLAENLLIFSVCLAFIPAFIYTAIVTPKDNK